MRCCTAISPGREQYAADDLPKVGSAFGSLLRASPLVAQHQIVRVGGGAGAREDAKALQG